MDPPDTFLFAPNGEARHYIIKSPVPRVGNQEPKAEGMGKEGQWGCAGDELSVRQLLQSLRGGEEEQGGWGTGQESPETGMALLALHETDTLMLGRSSKHTRGT